MLSCKTVRTNCSWQNDWSQGFRLCDQEELPCCDSCVKVPCQGHIRYSECGSTSAGPAIHYCWVQMGLNMSYLFILQYYLRHHAAIHQANAIQGWVQSSSTQIPQDVSYIYDWSGLIHKIPWKTGLTYQSLCGKYILGMLKTKYDQPMFCLMATQVVLLQKNNSHLRSTKSSGSTSSYLKEATYVHCLKRISSLSKWNNGGAFLLGDGMMPHTGNE